MIGRKEIIDNITAKQGKYDAPLIISQKEQAELSVVMSLYFKYMYEALLRGFSWHIHRFGDLKIEVKERDQKFMKPTPKYYKSNIRLINKRVFNPRTIGEIYKLEIKSSFLDKYVCRFKPADWFREKLSQTLLKTGKLLEYVD